MKGEKYDVVVIGGGPAGSSAAIRLATSGHKVLLVEKSRFPRQKLCGEFVSPECLEHFEELGVLQNIERHPVPRIAKTVFYGIRGRSLAIANSWLDGKGLYSIGLSRALMDDLLLARAKALGVDVRHETSLVRPIIKNGIFNGVELRSGNCDEYSIKARIAVDASGRGRSLCRHFDVHRPRKAELVAFKAHIRNARIEKGTCEIFSYSGGYGGCNEIEAGLYNLCFIARSSIVKEIHDGPEAVLREIVLKNSRANEVLSSAEIESDWLAVPISRFGRAELVPAPGVIAVGDAASFIDPFTGSGIALALESSRLASAAISANTDLNDIASEYKRFYAKAFDRRLQFCGILRLVSTAPLFAEIAIAALGQSSYLSKRFAEATRFNAISATDTNS